MMKFKVLFLTAAIFSYANVAMGQDSSRTEGSTQCVTATAASPDGTCADSITPPAHSTGPVLLGENTNPKAPLMPTNSGSEKSPAKGTSDKPAANGRQ